MSAPTLDPVRAYRTSMRRARLVYAATIAVVLLVVGILVAVAYARGEANNSRLTTAAPPPAALPQSTVATTVSKAWSTSDLAAADTPYSGGTVITYSPHRVNGRSVRTGAITWSYLRSNRALCDVVQAADQTFALWQVKGNCDQLTALSSQTGALQWTRTLSIDDHPVNGRPTVSYASSTLLIATPQVIYAVAAGDKHQGLNRWKFYRAGCTIGRAVMGTAGALISMSCTGTKCDAGEQFCNNGDQLLLRDPYAGDDNNDKKNPDKIKWMVPESTWVPVAADGQVLAYDPVGGATHVLDDKGKSTRTVAIGGVDASTVAYPVGTSELVWAGGMTYAVTSSAIGWRAATGGLPTVTDLAAGNPDLSSASTVLAVPGTSGAQLLGGGGKPTQTVAVGALTPGSRVYPYGGGLIVATATGTFRYR